jgi:hypothetical protein
MRTIILLALLSLSTITQLNAVVVVHHANTSSLQQVDKVQKILVNKSQSGHFSFKKLFKRITHLFEFDLSDPVDGWLTLAIICFGAALALLLISAIVGGIYVLGIIASILAIGGFASFIIWALKAFS